MSKMQNIAKNVVMTKNVKDDNKQKNFQKNVKEITNITRNHKNDKKCKNTHDKNC